MFKLESAKEMLDKAEAAMDCKNWIEANHWIVNFLCARLNKHHPIADQDSRYEELRTRLEHEMDIGVWLDAVEQALDSKNTFAAEENLLTFEENAGGGRVTTDLAVRYRALKNRYYDVLENEISNG